MGLGATGWNFPRAGHDMQPGRHEETLLWLSAASREVRAFLEGLKIA